MPISPARQIAYEVLRRVEAEDAYASDLLHTELGAKVKPQDAALATELTMGVLRWRRLLDFWLRRHLKKPIEQADLPVAIALRMGLYQLRFLQRIPARAAVSESVEIVKRARKSSAASLVNAVLRRAAEEAGSPAKRFMPADLSEIERLAIFNSHPTWLVERWLAQFGEARTNALLEENNHAPRLSCVVWNENERETIFAELAQAGIRSEPGQLLKDAFSVKGGSPFRSQAFTTGKISIQDEASQAIPLLLGVKEGESVLDLCAAPGGKTMRLARLAGGSSLLVASDLHAHRLRAMRAQFGRIGIKNIRLVELDATKTLPFSAKFDRILVDAPCSGTGTLARHPEIRWRLRPEQLWEFGGLQTEILARALEQLKPGGRLVYATCSLEKEENDDVVAEALRRFPGSRRVAAEEIAATIAPYLQSGVNAANLIDEKGQFRTFPGEQETDGFFAAAITKIAE
jgi:16S rRNA (cytosine967-C5)-methyltransferase